MRFGRRFFVQPFSPNCTADHDLKIRATRLDLRQTARCKIVREPDHERRP
jgi:hypothetical protein